MWHGGGMTMVAFENPFEVEHHSYGGETHGTTILEFVSPDLAVPSTTTPETIVADLPAPSRRALPPVFVLSGRVLVNVYVELDDLSLS